MMNANGLRSSVLNLASFTTTIIMKDYIQNLNQCLSESNVDFERLTKLIQDTYNNKKTKFRVVNAGNYTESVLEKTRADKLKFARMEYFEKAAASMNLEYECEKYLEFKNQLSNNDPIFIDDQCDITLLYFQDREIVRIISKIICGLP